MALELQDDLGRGFVVGRLEDLDDVISAERDVDADEAAAGPGDDPLAILDALAPGRQAGDALRGPAHQRHVVRHPQNILLAWRSQTGSRSSPAPALESAS